MASATMNVLTLYNWTNDHDEPDIFRDFVVPEEVDKDVVVDAILLKAAPFEILYPDFEYLQFSIGAWSKRWYRTMDKWITALNIEYDPLNNYDRHEEWTDEDNVSGSTETSATSGGTAEDELSVVAYNSDTYHI